MLKNEKKDKRFILFYKRKPQKVVSMSQKTRNRVLLITLGIHMRFKLLIRL